ncbi:hypothetical protein [Neisseria musculi]|uniref:hypothetical protein n=1 Tax=Neisseria musculi TaxID=1815583 RepID=UPI00336BFF73
MIADNKKKYIRNGCKTAALETGAMGKLRFSIDWAAQRPSENLSEAFALRVRCFSE